MKKTLLIALCAIVGLTACSEPTTVTLDQQVLQMLVDQNAVLKATATGGVAVEWSTSDSAVASVTYGAVTANMVGSATITATAGDATATCQVYVTDASGATISLLPYQAEVAIGETFQFNGRSVYNVPVTWSVEDSTVATVTQTGLVTALAGGVTKLHYSNGVETKSATVIVPQAPYGEYQLVWSDEFDGTQLNTDYWNIEVNGNGGGNNEAQYYTARPENIRVQNGFLEIEARKEAYEGRNYTSGRITTQKKKAFTYGRIEARISVPKGRGTWPAFWTLGENIDGRGWPRCGEIDIMEHVGNDPTMISFALHTGAKNGMNGKHWHHQYYRDNVEETFIEYAIEWRKESFEGRDEIAFFVDGVQMANTYEDAGTINDTYYWPYVDPQFILLNLAIGGTMGGAITDSDFDQPVVMKVDYVRVYQRTGESL